MGSKSTKEFTTSNDNIPPPSPSSPDDIPWNSVKHLAKHSNFSTKDVECLYKIFKDIASKSPNPSMIQKYQFEQALNEAGLKDLHHDELVNTLFTTFDEAKDNQINFNEFISGLSVVSKGSPREKLILAFEVFDLENNGHISRDEMIKMLSIFDQQAVQLSKNSGELTKQQRDNNIIQFVDYVFNEYDREKNGQLSFVEFQNAVLNHPDLKEIEPTLISDLVHAKPI